jgi:hypothetical protein
VVQERTAECRVKEVVTDGVLLREQVNRPEPGPSARESMIGTSVGDTTSHATPNCANCRQRTNRGGPP